jgi:hypothetical protein
MKLGLISGFLEACPLSSILMEERVGERRRLCSQLSTQNPPNWI